MNQLHIPLSHATSWRWLDGFLQSQNVCAQRLPKERGN
ncbi:hypothetical protein SAMN05428952_100249 [Nitrosomonas sp. Nm132]|jgi:hypothetical protein|nr:hypothetical protein SAMN05428952_100249 [Nitrosomonas sp. Nm132]